MDERSMLSEVNSDEPIIVKALGKRHGVRYKDKIVYKIIMGGGSNRGATSFITRYTAGKFQSTTPTIGGKSIIDHFFVVEDIQYWHCQSIAKVVCKDNSTYLDLLNVYTFIYIYIFMK